MKSKFSCLSLVFAVCLTAVVAKPFSQADFQVANYSIGKYGKPGYEHFSFSVENGKIEVDYSYNSADNTLTLTYLGSELYEGKQSFKVQFSNGRVFYVRPVGLKLEVTDRKAYSKVFRWEYEGPVDGRGTFCSACAENPTEAMRLIKKHFLK